MTVSGDSPDSQTTMLTLIGRELEFKGIHASFRAHDVDDSEITTLAPGQSVGDVIDVADTVDLSEGGRGYIQSNGFVHLVIEHRVWDKIPFASNVLTMNIDPYEASKVSMAYDQHLARRADFKSETCNDSQASIIRKGLQKAGELCDVAADAAAHGPEKQFKKFFTNTDSKTRAAVAQRFRKISVEALSTDHGKSSLHCGDTHNVCKGSIVAYTWHSTDETVVPCPSFFSEPVFDKSCVQSTTSGIMLHEISHVKGVLDPTTKDHAYGFYEAQKLSAAEQFTNADNYAYFASCELGFTPYVG